MTIGDDDLGFDDLSMLSSRLEYLPLALIQAAAFIQENSISVCEHLRLLNKSDQDLVDLLSEEFETVGRDSKTPRTVAETRILSFEQIQRQNAFVSELLSLMSLFDRHAISLKFLLDYSKQESGQEPRGDIQLTKALGVLKAFSFVLEEENRGLNMHRLVQLVTRKWLVKTGKMSQFAGQALLVVLYCYPFGRYKNWVTCTAYLPHVDTVLMPQGTGSRDEKLAQTAMLQCVAGLFYYQGRLESAEEFQTRGLRDTEEVVRVGASLNAAEHGQSRVAIQESGPVG